MVIKTTPIINPIISDSACVAVNVICISPLFSICYNIFLAGCLWFQRLLPGSGEVLPSPHPSSPLGVGGLPVFPELPIIHVMLSTTQGLGVLWLICGLDGCDCISF